MNYNKAKHSEYKIICHIECVKLYYIYPMTTTRHIVVGLAVVRLKMVQNLLKNIKDCGVHFYIWADKKKDKLQLRAWLKRNF